MGLSTVPSSSETFTCVFFFFFVYSLYVPRGSVYCDGSIRRQGFNGEKINSGAVLIVKAHVYYNKKWTDVMTESLKDEQKLQVCVLL